MPNLVVYVPADVARALEALGVPQNIQRKACQEVLVELSNGGLEERAPMSVNDRGVSSSQPSRSSSPSGCPGYVPAGVRCKLCGQVHQQKGKRS